MSEPEYVTLDVEECDRLWAMLDAGEYWGGTGVVRSLVRTIKTLRAENERLEAVVKFEAMRFHGLLIENERLEASYADATTLVDSWMETACKLQADLETVLLDVITIAETGDRGCRMLLDEITARVRAALAATDD